LDAAATQEEVFHTVAKSLVENLLHQGKTGLIFAYGVTNSGKTFTVEGSHNSKGLIPRILEQIFSSPQQSNITAYVSYLQIYNDHVHDLQESLPMAGPNDLMTPPRKNLKLKVPVDSCVIVEGLKETKISNIKEGMAILERGRQSRKTDDNNINQTSSRSHTVWNLRIGQATLHVVDLAGSERGLSVFCIVIFIFYLLNIVYIR